MAVVNSDILRIIAFNDYKHDSKPKHGVRGASPEDVKLFVTPTLPIGISSAGISSKNPTKIDKKNRKMQTVKLQHCKTVKPF